MSRTRSGIAVATAVFLSVSVTSFVVARLAADAETASRAALASSRTARAAARGALDASVHDRVSLQGQVAGREAERVVLADALRKSVGDLDSTTLSVLDARNRTAVGDRTAGRLDACLAGVGEAIHAPDATRAAAALRRSQPACADALAESGSAAFPYDFPDPFVLRVGPLWFAYSTNAGVGNVQVLVSLDRQRWTIVGNALPATASWAERGATWAPAVIARPGGFALFYSARDRSTRDQCISVATARNPQGPFVDGSDEALLCQHDLGGSIDASPFTDADGRTWLTWKSERPATIWSRQLDLGHLRLTGPATPILHASLPWEHGNVEAPSFLRAGPALLLAYSGNRWDTADYAVGLATCAGPAGPCVKRGPGPVLGSRAGAVGPGGAELFPTDTGPAIAYAAYAGPGVGYPASRLLHLTSFDPLTGAPGPG